ncbi:hypothetical protein ACFSKU_20925 [Pontibacter silvestris]|uniref:Uncharacterized protein n=1 Tax=Pontibacter silvestris TaxID=2305183 RepID=A0ABW4X5Q4_9BACT
MDLSSTAGVTFQQPLLEQVTEQYPELSILDLDTQSDELMQHYAKKLLQEAEQSIICIKGDRLNIGFGKLTPILEELLRPEKGRLVLLLGWHSRLQRMLQARPLLQFKQVEDEDRVLEETEQFLRKD